MKRGQGQGDVCSMKGSSQRAAGMSRRGRDGRKREGRGVGRTSDQERASGRRNRPVSFAVWFQPVLFWWPIRSLRPHRAKGGA